ncbi:hypothetical protein diail_7441 [Diaporthe ilicicola]|nr:hypothetical protein diail_7441 [Diaporthe ilicicola]
MSLHPSSRVIRRPQVYITFVCFLVFLLALAKFNVSTSVDFLSSSRQSPYYIKDESHYYTWETPSFLPPLKSPHNGQSGDLCEGFPTHLLEKVQVVMKTGTGEAAKTKAHLDSVSSCITNILIFSDLEETIGGHQFIDILADLPPSYHKHPDFEAYSAQKKAHDEGKLVEYSAEGWKLDRFKFLPMVDKAYQMRPNADWYVFIEADVYYFWGMSSIFSLSSQTASE